jgi:hypothetical protein
MCLTCLSVGSGIVTGLVYQSAFKYDWLFDMDEPVSCSAHLIVCPFICLLPVIQSAAQLFSRSVA